jgi:hypothetical protein
MPDANQLAAKQGLSMFKRTTALNEKAGQVIP